MRTFSINRILMYIFSVCLSLIFLPAFPQGEIQREVRVVKPYTPTLSDVGKINILPEFLDTVRIIPDFNYFITPKRFNTTYQPEQIKPARMVGLPLEKLYKSHLSLGVGNYLSQMGELHINQLRSRTSSMGVYLKHHSSGGKVMLDNSERVFAGFSDNAIDIYGKRFLKKSVLEGGINGDFNRVHFYGYNTDVDTMLERTKIRQSIYSTGAQIQFYSAHHDSSSLKYKLASGYQFTMDGFENSEHSMSLSGDFGKLFREQYIGLHIGMHRYVKSASIDSTNNTILRLNPFISKRSKEWKFLVGINSAIDINGEDIEFKIYPRAEFEFQMVENVLTPYFGVDGYRSENNYRKILYENPFIIPGLNVKNSNYGIVAYAGFKGRYSSKMAYNFRGSYSLVQDMHFFINDTSNVLGNQFDVTYDDVSITTLAGDVSWHQSEKLKFLLKGRIYNYELPNSRYPWHKPKAEFGFGATYNLRDKIIVDSDIFYKGKRYALAQDLSAAPIQLNGYIDANMEVEYRYTKLLSFFIRFNNFTSSRFHIWNQYPAQRFQIIGGFTYSL